MRSSPLLLFSASGSLAANYAEHGRMSYNTSASTTATLAHSTGSASGYWFLNAVPTTLRTSVLPGVSLNRIASVDAYGFRPQKTEPSAVSSSASPARLSATNYTMAANMSHAAPPASAPLVFTPAPVYQASSRTNRTAAANVTTTVPHAAAAYATVSVAAAASAPAYLLPWPPANLSAPANGSSGAPRASSHHRPYIFAPPNNATYNSSSSSSSRRLSSPALASGAPVTHYPTLAHLLDAALPKPEPATALGPEIKTFWTTRVESVSTAPSAETQPTVR